MPEELLYEGKAKKLFITEDPQILRVEYKDDATAFNGEKFDRLKDKGRLNNAITVFFFEHLDTKDIPSHFVRKISETCLLYTSPSPRDRLLSRMPSSA